MTTMAPPKSKASSGKSGRKPAPARATRSARSVRAEEAAATAVVEELLRTPSRGLDPASRAVMERTFGHDFSGVRIHCDDRAADFATALHAEAFTVGQDVFFGPGAYRPHTPAGRRLIAHELTHTLQQRQPGKPYTQTPARALYRLTGPETPAEQEATRGDQTAADGSPKARVFVPIAAEPGTVARRSLGSILRGVLTEVLDPARLTDTFAQNLIRKLHSDPDDRAGRIRLQIAGLAPLARAAVLDRIEATLNSADWERLVRVLDQPVPSGLEGVETTGDQESPQPVADESSLKGDKRDAASQGVEPAKPEAELADDVLAKARKIDPSVISADEAATSEQGEAAPKVPQLKPGAAEASVAVAGAAPAMGGGEAKAAATGGPTGATAEVGAVAGGAGGPDPETLVEEMAPPIARKSAERAADETVAGQEDSAAGPIDETSRQQSGTLVEGDAHAEASASPARDEAPSTSASPDGAVDEAPTADAAPPSPEPAPPEPSAVAEPAVAEPTASISAPPPEPQLAATPEAAAGPVSEAPGAPEAPAATPEENAPAAETSPADSSGADATAPADASAAGGAGSCSAPTSEPPARSEPDVGGGCGGGGGAIAEKPAVQTPDVSRQDPAAAMATIAGLPPGEAQAALGGAAAAAKRSVGEQRAELQASPPQLENPTGAPEGRAGTPASIAAPKSAAAAKIERKAAGTPAPATQPAPAPPLPEAPRIQAPRVTTDAQQKLSQDDIRNVQVAANDLQTTDPALDDANAGPAPELVLEGDADPGHTDEQRTALDKGVTQTQTSGRDDAAQPMGEKQVYPKARTETLRAEVPAAEKTTCSKEGGEGKGAEEGDGANGAAISAIAQERRGDEIRAAAADSQTSITARRGEHEESVATAKEDSQRETDKLVAENAELQAKERGSVGTDVKAKRDDWVEAQDKEVSAAGEKADDAAAAAGKEITVHRTQADKDVNGHLTAGNTKIRDARAAAESKAREQKAKAKNEADGGLLGWIGSKITSFFAGIVSAIKDAFAYARSAVKGFIAEAQKLAAGVIDYARKKVVAAIKLAGDVIVAAGDVVLAAFPKLRDRFRTAIQKRVDSAVATVNKLADVLTAGVQALLGLLGKALDAALGLLECGLLAVVAVYQGVIVGALKFASSVVKAFGEFAVIIKDIAADPGKWVANLGKAVRDGIRNCLWSAFKTAVKDWFNSKVEEVLGLGRTIWKVLTSGCISLAMVAKMAWQAILQSLPGIVIQLLIEKLVSLLVPAASALMLIIEGVKAAWGTVSRIIAAFERFLAFLKAVRSGTAAGAFAKTLAAAGIALIDFIANWLLQRLKGPAGGVSSALKKMAERIGKVLKKVGAAVIKGVRAVGRALKRARKAVMGGVRAVGRGALRAGKAIANSKIGKYVRNSRLGKAIGRARDSVIKLIDRRKNRPKLTPEQRLARAVRSIHPRLARLLKRGVPGFILRGTLAVLRTIHRLRSLSIQGKNPFKVIARVNPEEEVISGVMIDPEELLLYVGEVAREIQTHPTVVAHAKEILASQTFVTTNPRSDEFGVSLGSRTDYHVQPQHSAAAVAVASAQAKASTRGRIDEFHYGGAEGTVVRRSRSYGDSSNKLVLSQGDLRARPYLSTDTTKKRTKKGTKEGTKKGLTSDLSSLSPDEAASGLKQFLHSPAGVHGEKAGAIADLGTALVVQESHRNPASLVTAPLVADLAAREGLEPALKTHPMLPKGAPKAGRDLSSYLGVWEYAKRTGKSIHEIVDPSDPSKAERLRLAAKSMLDAEFALIKTWLKTQGALDFDDNSSAEAKKSKIKRAIRERAFKAYGLEDTKK